MVIVGFIRGRLVHSGAAWGSWGSSGSVCFTRERSGGRWVLAGLWVHPRSLGSLGCTMGVVGYIWGGRVHYSAPWGSLGLFAFV